MSTRIIVCDDELHITRAIQMKLAKAGFDVETAANGKDGLDAARRARPDLIVSDYQMPVMDGLELCRSLRGDETLRDVPFILLTAKGYELDEARLREEHGVTTLFVKPFSPRELLETVQTVLAASGAVAT